MMEKTNDVTSLTFWSVALPLLLCVTPMSVHAQGARPNVFVSMYFVGERVACPPDGYDESGRGTRTCRRQLTFDALEELTEQGIATPVQQSIPPEQLRLGASLLDSIEAFSDDCTIDTPCTEQPERRYSIVLAFEVDGVQDFDGHEIEIRRVLPGTSQFNEYTSSGNLSEQGRWINHQRADIFLPSYGVRWELQLDEWTWNLGTER